MKTLIAENLMLKQQLLLLTRSRKRAPTLSALDRFLLGPWPLVLDPPRIRRAAILVKPSTLLRCHQALIKWKYRLLFSSRKRGKPGPKGCPFYKLVPIEKLEFFRYPKAG